MKSLAAVENALKLPNTARVINSSSSAQKPSTAGTGTTATKRKNYHNNTNTTCISDRKHYN